MGGECAIGTTLTINATSTTPKPGDNVYLSGVLTRNNDGMGLQGLTVGVSQSVNGGAWSTVKSVATDQNGDWLISDYIVPGNDGDSIVLKAEYGGGYSSQSEDKGPIFVNCPPGYQWDMVRKQCTYPDPSSNQYFGTWFIIFTVTGLLSAYLYDKVQKKGGLKKAIIGP